MRRWPYTFIVGVSVAIGITVLVASNHVGLSLKDPEGFLGPAYVRLPLIAVLMFSAGIVPQAIHRYGIKRIPHGVREIIRTEWTWYRFSHIAVGLLAFYACYVSYRNLKSYLPLLREDLYDNALQRMDYWMFFGNYPATIMHDVLGTGVSAQVLATIYISYLMLIPITLGAYLVLHKDASIGAWYATALSLNWVLGTASYYMLPTQGPAFFQPQLFRELDGSGASALQQSLFRNGSAFREDPTGDSIYGIAGFASLHVSVVFTACLFFERTGIPRTLRVVAWTYFAGTVLATVYFGWHYVLDDIGGLVIGWASVSLGAWATGNSGRNLKKERRARERAEAGSGEGPPGGSQSTAGDEGAGGTVVSTA
ncbi:hypothetical protein HMPREF0063_11179 [Aeromicrobium marinum DSM 15272]|uniref:Inositolphosphotransferase Aur1/Ipt1 domain-containing protein n=1 Tax=Aeromicrobium marinum DSM 15272 TaxID=585531 RepID=E2SAX1_9ACTN|nr:phosphatase PAP2 family protein [Aeromicrobium marinum]EFQ83517.1 hypothetical protein HMPREF0063_11179 [Aeromicrobium marinum DSM 15272]